MATMLQTISLKAPDDRELCVEIAGAGPRSILIHSGTPNSRHLYWRWVEDAARRGVRLISYDRPGYGGSSPQPGHSVADGASDVRAIADQLGIERFGVWGLSGGGPYALACAALLGDRVVAAGVVGSLAPWNAPGLDYFEGMGQANADGVRRYLEDPEKDRRDLHESRD